MYDPNGSESNQAEPKTDTDTSTANNAPAAPVKSNNKKKLQKRQQRQFKAMIGKYRLQQERQNRRLKRNLNIVKNALSKEDFKAMKSICTVNVPEQKDENGTVIQAASTQLNKHALVIECRHLIALNREARIESGKRKRSTGRSTDRTTHKNLVKFLVKRNEIASKETPSAEG